MKQEIKERWLGALRSGEYKQGEAELRPKEDQFCCLGVLSDLYLKEEGLEWGCGDVQPQNISLPPTVREWAGDIDPDPQVDDPLNPGEISTLSNLNDSGDFTFEGIAKVIEEQL